MGARPLLLALLGLAWACGGESPRSSDAEAACVGALVDEGDGAECIERVEGRLVEATGSPLSGLLVTVCGPVCFSPEADQLTDDDGRFAVLVGSRLRAERYALSVHGRPLHASATLPLQGAGAVRWMGDVPVLALPEGGPALAVRGEGAPAQQLASGGATLEIEEGVEVRLDVDDVALGELGKRFRAASVPPAWHAVFAPGLGPLLGLYALAPYDVSFRRVETGAAAGARVSLRVDTPAVVGDIEWLAQGSLMHPEWVAPGTWGKVAQGTVTPDGLAVLDEGSTLPHLTWLAVRERP